MINWNCPRYDEKLVAKIVERAKTTIEGIKPRRLAMDLIATHLNGCKLNLEDLLLASQGLFQYDVLGIDKNINRRTGKIENDFKVHHKKSKLW